MEKKTRSSPRWGLVDDEDLSIEVVYELGGMLRDCWSLLRPTADATALRTKKSEFAAPQRRGSHWCVSAMAPRAS